MTTPAVAWFEVTGRDGAALQRFYGELFGWPVQDAGDGYGLVEAGPGGVGGGIGGSPDGGPGQVTFYVEVDDLVGALRRAEELGGRTVAPPTKIDEFGLELAHFADPEGRVVGLSTGAVR